MQNGLKQNLSICKQIISNCDIDYAELKKQQIDKSFFDNYENTRIVNSFLFNYSKLQDKIGTKLIKQILFELKEIDDFSMPFRDVLNICEKLELFDVKEWDRFREIRNILSHEYPMSVSERIENISLAIEFYPKIKTIFQRLYDAVK